MAKYKEIEVSDLVVTVDGDREAAIGYYGKGKAGKVIWTGAKFD